MLSANLSPHKPVGLNARVRALVHICVCGNLYARKSVVCTQMRHIARLLVSNTCMQLCMLTLSLSLFSLSLSPSHTHITRLIVSCMNLCMLTFIEAFKKCNDISLTHTQTQTHRHRHRQTDTDRHTDTHKHTEDTPAQQANQNPRSRQHYQHRCPTLHHHPTATPCRNLFTCLCMSRTSEVPLCKHWQVKEDGQDLKAAHRNF